MADLYTFNIYEVCLLLSRPDHYQARTTCFSTHAYIASVMCQPRNRPLHICSQTPRASSDTFIVRSPSHTGAYHPSWGQVMFSILLPTFHPTIANHRTMYCEKIAQPSVIGCSITRLHLEDLLAGTPFIPSQRPDTILFSASHSFYLFVQVLSSLLYIFITTSVTSNPTGSCAPCHS